MTGSGASCPTSETYTSIVVSVAIQVDLHTITRPQPIATIGCHFGAFIVKQTDHYILQIHAIKFAASLVPSVL